MQITIREPTDTEPPKRHHKGPNTSVNGGEPSRLLTPAAGLEGRNRSLMMLNATRQLSTRQLSTRQLSMMDRGGKSAADRARSTLGGRAPPEVFRPVTIEDINMALSMISTDGKRITHTNLRAFFEKYFPPHLMPPKLAKILINQNSVNSKEETITKEQLHSMLLSRQCAEHFDGAFQLIEHEHGEVLHDASIKRILKCMDSKYGMLRRGDLAAIKERFDRDKDGVISRDDFKKMNMRQL
ncbi:hypothetical protein BJ741DRAFT_653840 [Chytriomyces cf. hyalinus JEL632]|nr:hypothetical protein BJ741DRAFT_653840 [Chytriomyces cf. hyalinus JEL632]